MDDTRYPYENSTSAQSGRIVLDYRLWWGIPTLIVAVVGFVWLNSGRQAPVLALLWAFLVVGTYIVSMYAKMLGDDTLFSAGARVGLRAFFDFAGWFDHVRSDVAAGQSIDEDGAAVPRKPNKMPRILARVDTLAYKPPTKSGDVGIFRDISLDTWSMTFWLTGVPPLMLDPTAVDRRLTWFGSLLDQLDPTTSNIHRLRWSTLSLPESLPDLDDLVGKVESDVEARAGMAVLEDLMALLSQSAPRNITTMTLTLHGPSAKRAAQQHGGPEAVLLREVEAFIQSFRNKRHELQGASILTPDQLVELTELYMDPVSIMRSQRSLFEPRPDRPPLQLRDVLDRYYDLRPADHWIWGKTCHHGYFLDAPDRGEAALGDFAALASMRGIPKVVTTVVSVRDRRGSIKRAQLKANAARSAQKDREQDGGRVTGTEAHLAATTDQADRDTVASRHRIMDERTYVDVFGPPGLSVAYAAEFESQMAMNSDLVVVPLDGQQDLGLQALLPAGRGLEGGKNS